MNGRNESFALILSTLLLAAFLIAALFGATISFSQDEHGHMVNCPWMKGHSLLCPMSELGHMAKWQQAFLALIPLLIIGLIAVLSARAAFRLKFTRLLHEPPDLSRQIAGLFSFLQRYFSNGILHPKLFA